MSLFKRTYTLTHGNTRDVWAYDFTVTARLPGGTVRKRLAGVLGDISLTAARARYARLRKEAEAMLWEERPARGPVPTVAAFAPRFLAHYRLGKDPASVREMESYHRRLAKTFDAVPLDRLTEELVSGYMAAREAQGRSPTTINKELRFLRQMCRLAVRWGLLTENPMSAVTRLPEPQPQRILSRAEEARLLEACTQKFRTLVILALDAGLRRGDITALRWRHIHLRQRMIEVPARGAQPKATGRRPKTETGRLVGMTDRVFALLSDLWQNDPDGAVSPYRYKSVDGFMALACRKAGITGLRFHDLRHTFATRLTEADVNLEKVRQVLGHRRIQTTQRYLHLSDRHTATVVEVLNPRPTSTNPPTAPDATSQQTGNTE